MNHPPFILAVCQSLKKYLPSGVNYQEAAVMEIRVNFSKSDEDGDGT